MNMFLIYVVICIICVTLLVCYIGKPDHKYRNMPPSPFNLPILGNLLLMNDVPHLVFDKLSQTYGKMFTFWIGRRPVVIINDEEICKQALYEQAYSFSGRPHRYSGGLYSRNFKGIVLSDDDAGWRYRKKVAISALRKFIDTGNGMEKTVVEECEELMKRLRPQGLTNQELDLRKDISLAMLNIICALVFGSRYDIEDAEFREIAEVNTKFLYGIQCAAIVDAFPFLRYLPYKKLRWIKEFVITRDRILGMKYKEHDKNFLSDHVRDFTDVLIKASRDLIVDSPEKCDYLSSDHKIVMMGDFFLAGVETIATALSWAILYCIKWPRQQKLIQQELDSIYDKYKEFSYRRRTEMPVTEAAITEVLRLSAVAPLGVPHKVTMDTNFCGYDIPKGTILIFNIHAMNQNVNIWEKPMEFNLNRFLNDNGQFVHPTGGFLSFGIGRRICPGESLARMELFYFLSNLLHEFDFNAMEEPVSLQGHYATSWSPLPYKVKLSVRR